MLPDSLCISDVERSEPTPSVPGSRAMTRGERIVIAAWLPSMLSALGIAAVVFS